jgi:hypothetical protein
LDESGDGFNVVASIHVVDDEHGVQSVSEKLVRLWFCVCARNATYDVILKVVWR